jgi:hypothetical protein
MLAPRLSLHTLLTLRLFLSWLIDFGFLLTLRYRFTPPLFIILVLPFSFRPLCFLHSFSKLMPTFSPLFLSSRLYFVSCRALGSSPLPSHACFLRFPASLCPHFHKRILALPPFPLSLQSAFCYQSPSLSPASGRRFTSFISSKTSGPSRTPL